MMSENPLPVIPAETLEGARKENPTNVALKVFEKLNAALAKDDGEDVKDCFFADQAFWKDQLALTYHLRTFSTPETIALSLLETEKLRSILGGIHLSGEAQFIPATPTLQFINCVATFKTASPAATCSGRLVLLPVKAKTDDFKEALEWKIWILSTKLESLKDHPENEVLLKASRRELKGLETFKTDVLIIGGGNAAFTLAARLKALGVDSVMIERNARPGDNWALRYDSLKFHVPTSMCELPYMNYDKKLLAPHLLTKDDLAEQARRYVAAMNLNFVSSAKIKSTVYDQSKDQWRIKFNTPDGEHTAIAKHLVQATGVSSQKPYTPEIPGRQIYKGVSVHSADYKNAVELRERGLKSALIIGSANTAFDLLQDCCDAGLQTTMVVRSPTYIVPLDYICNPQSLGAYDLGVEASDRMFLTLPACVDGQFGRGLFAQFAQQEPDRYSALAEAGFPVLDSRDPDCALMHNLLERAGGHYVDAGATRLIVERRAGIKAGAEPVAFTSTGLRFSDGTTADADAVIWCTGFADKDARATAAEILGEGETNGFGPGVDGNKNILGPRDIAARLDPTWNLDDEVVGGGAAGAHAAVWLRDHNQSVVLVERSNQLGGHTASYHDPASGKSINIGVQAWMEYKNTFDFVHRMNVTTSGVMQFTTLDYKYIDFRTGQPTNFTAPAADEMYSALQRYLDAILPYEDMVLPGFEGFPNPENIPEDLLMPFIDFVEKYNLEAAVPQIWDSTAQGIGNTMDVPTLFVIQASGIPMVRALLGTAAAATPESGRLYDLYEAIAGLLGDDVLYSSTVSSSIRTAEGVSLMVTNADGNVCIKAKRMLIAFEPTAENMAPFDIDDSESEVFEKFGFATVYAGVLRHPSLQASTAYSNRLPETGASNNTVFPKPSQVGRIDYIGGTEDLFQFTAVGTEGDTSETMKNLITQRIDAMIEAGTIPQINDTVTFPAFANHGKMHPRVTAEDLHAGFIQKQLALQGHLSTWYTGAAFSAGFSTVVWEYNNILLPNMIQGI
ncbi:hypothetical protein CkaCkLH20_11575 [Colletotrichum karsti]|uniref:FAD/NAD(P)-binding domain-containing protein n=1 Tax=Colletotrichum karsti TaxID=1095194 RepID=A0A9P6HUE1_9PEZI|nr:uncharacterized protein CkaCkLH20_11575 [Colletotrichum karsti]KAF9870903.1 hypothetical protein CkaCkLH20_11575 [Colletotrichum karsti]